MMGSGYSLEWRCCKVFRDHGFKSERIAGSGSFDVMAFKTVGSLPRLYVVECKNTTNPDRKAIYVPRQQLDILLECARTGLGFVVPVVVFSFRNQKMRVARVSPTSEGSMKITPDMGVDLREELQRWGHGGLTLDGVWSGAVNPMRD